MVIDIHIHALHAVTHLIRLFIQLRAFHQKPVYLFFIGRVVCFYFLGLGGFKQFCYFFHIFNSQG